MSALARLRVGPLTRPLVPRELAVTALALLAAAGIGLLALTLGELTIPLRDAIDAIIGARTDFTATVVAQWRLPRILAALACGAALGASGAIFQALTRNPLGTPDVLGFSTGAYTGALLVIVVLGGPWSLVAVGALIGGVGTALAVMALAGTEGSMLRLVLIGVGAAAALSAVNHWLIAHAEIDVALSASMFGSGSLNGVAWPRVLPTILAVLVGLALAAGAARILGVLELGDDAAGSLGVRVPQARRTLMILGIVLVAAPTALIGPVAFVALMAPSIARRLAGGGGCAPLTSAAIGALLLLGADVLAQRLVAPAQLPVGVVTGCIGGLYLIVLLLRGVR